MLDAMKRARQFEREMFGGRGGRVRVKGDRGGFAPDDEAFACAWVCQGCGFMRDAPKAQADADQTCRHCRARAWIDLRSFRNAQLLREQEQRLREDAPDWVQHRVRGAAGVAGVAIGGAAALAAGAMLPLLAPVAVIAAAIGGAGAMGVEQIIGKPLSRWLIARADVGPARWRCALPKPNLESEVVARHAGTATTRQAPLAAPISGRECIAYEVGVVFDAEGDAYPPVWVVREDRNVAFEVGDVDVAADALTTELTMLSVSDQANERDRGDIAKFLRQRGLFVADGEYSFFESVLPVGAEIELVRHAEPAQSPWVVYDPAAPS